MNIALLSRCLAGVSLEVKAKCSANSIGQCKTAPQVAARAAPRGADILKYLCINVKKHKYAPPHLKFIN